MRFLIGQRVLLNGDEIGTIVPSQNPELPNTLKDVWVMSPSKGFASRYSVHNVEPLPGGQL